MEVIDFHSHILPGMDDGSQDVETSLQMLRMSAKQGIRHMVATPHFYPRYDDPAHFLKKRDRAARQLRAAMESEPGLPGITLGAEVYFFSGISESDLIGTLTIGEKPCILIEMPAAPWKESHFRELEQIYVRHGITPIIAHIDRYIRPFHTYGIPKRLVKLPVLVQANAGFFLNRATQGMALRMLKQDQIHLLGSDCHNLSSRAPNLGEAAGVIEEHLGSSAIRRIRDRQLLVLPEYANPM